MIVIYTQDNCPACVAAKKLITGAFVELNLNDPANKKALFEKLPGVRSVPQIFDNDTHIGGLEEFRAYDKLQKAKMV